VSSRAVIIFITLGGWLIGAVIYGMWWVNSVLNTEPLYGYERSRVLIGSAFIAYEFPFLLIGLIVVLALELLFVPRPKRETSS
jgi:hypothetical protein